MGEENFLDNTLIVKDLSFKFKILVSISGELSKATSIFYIDSSATIRIYRIVASRSTSRLVTCLGLFRLVMKGIFGPYVL